MKIGELLVMNGLITQDQLQHALKQQIHSRKKLGELLLDNGNITERQLVEVLEFQLGIPAVHLNEVTLDKNTVHLIRESTARKFKMIPMEEKEGKIKIAMLDPLHHEAIQQIQLATGLIVLPFISSRSEIDQAIIQHYGVSDSTEEINQILQAAVEQKARDIHLIPDEAEVVIKFLIGNTLIKIKSISRNDYEALVNRINILFNLHGEQHGLPQEGRLSWQMEPEQIDLRASTLPTVNGEHILIRLMNPMGKIMKMTELGLSASNYQTIEKLFQQPSGLILVSGPSFSGKSSTMYSILQELNKDDLNIISIEDPVEHRLRGVSQVEVNKRVGYSYSSALHSALYHNPNIVMLGDISDKESADMVVRASLADCLLVCGTPGRNAVQTISRLTEIGLDPHLIAASLSGVLSQRLARKVCVQCAQTVPASEEETKIFEQHHLLHLEDLSKGSKSIIGNFRTYVTAHISGKFTVIRGRGCHICNNTGYHGHLAIHEVLETDKTLKELILKSMPPFELEQYLKEREYKTMLYDGLLKAREGITTVEEVLRVV